MSLTILNYYFQENLIFETNPVMPILNEMQKSDKDLINSFMEVTFHHSLFRNKSVQFILFEDDKTSTKYL